MVNQGDVLKINFNPQKGHEQAGYRPAIVVNNKLLSKKTTLAFLCPVTHTNRKNPFHYKIDGYDFIDGYVMCDQIKTMDLRARDFKIVGRLDDGDVRSIIERIEMLLEFEREN